MAAKQKQKQNQFQIFIRLVVLFWQGIISAFGRSLLPKLTKLKHHQNQKNNQNIRKIRAAKLARSLFTSVLAFILTISFSSINLWFTLPAYAAGALYIEPLTWDFIGLDSNNVNVGPNTFFSGARVCNIGTTALTNIDVEFIKLGSNPHITITATGLNTDKITIPTLSAGSRPAGHNSVADSGNANITPANCYNAYFNVIVTRTAAAYDTTLPFKIQAKAGALTVDTNTALGNGSLEDYNYGTPVSQEIYVEKLLSQARNSVKSFSGPTTVYVGDTIEYTLVTATAPQGYEQLTVSSDFPNAVFEFSDIKTTYSSDAIVNSSVYQDACGWLGNPKAVGYHTASSACAGPVPNQDDPPPAGDGKIGGGNITTRYRVKILSTGRIGGGSNTIAVSHLINDFSGSSYHYNSDYGQGVGITYITILAAPDVTITKTATPIAPATFPGTVGTDFTYNLNVQALAGSMATPNGSTNGTTTVQDTLPSGMLFKSFTGSGWSCTNALGSVCAVGNRGTLTFSNPNPIAAGASSAIALTVTPTVPSVINTPFRNTATVSTPKDIDLTNNSSSVDVTINAAPDLKITKTGPVSVGQGQTGVTYNLALQNVSTVITSGAITVKDTFPPGLKPNATKISADNSTNWTCTASVESGLDVVTCVTNGSFTLAPSAITNILITADVPANATPGVVINTATVSGGSDGNSSNNKSELSIQIGSSPDLTIGKTSTPASFAKGGSATYNLTVSNVGNQATNGATITVTDILPTGISTNPLPLTNYSAGNSWTCNSSGQTVTCTNNVNLVAAVSGVAVPSGISTFGIPVTISPTAPGNSFVNQAFVSVPGDGNSTNNSTNLTTFTGPNVIIQKTAVGTFTVGSTTATYQIKVSNIGGTTTTGNIRFNDAIADNKVSYSTPSSLPSGWVCSVGLNPQSFSCTGTNPNLAPNASVTLTIPVTITTGVAQDVLNTATIDATINGGDTDLTDSPTNQETDNGSITNTGSGSVPDLTVSKTLSQTGSTGTYTITVRNSGTTATNGSRTVTMTDTLPTGVTVTSTTPNGWNCSNSGTPVVVTCTFVTAVAANTNFPLIILNVASLPTVGSFTNKADVSYNSNELNTSNNSFSLTTTILTPQDLTITKIGSSTLTQGQTGTYTLRVRNIGQTATSATQIFVTDTLPAEITATSAIGTGWSCPTVGATVSCTRSGALVGLAPGSSYEDITIVVQVAGNATIGARTNTAQITGTNVFPSTPPTAAGGETNTANNISSVNLAITGVPDLTITKNDSASVTPFPPFTQGGTGTYSFIVTNSGSVATSGLITVTDTLPIGITANFTNPTTFSGWTCNSTIILVGQTQTVTCTNSTVVNAGSTSTFSFPISIASDAPSSVTNNVQVSGGGESNSSNNTAIKITPITSFPDLTISKSHTGNFALSQTGATYTLRVVNIGSASTDNNTKIVTDRLPTGLTPTAASGNGWTCSFTGQDVKCTRSDLLVGNFTAYPDITITVNVASNASSPLVNTALITATEVYDTIASPVTLSSTNAAGGETNFSNNRATDSTAIVAPPDLAITKTRTGPNFTQGQVGAAYTLRVQNVSATALAAGNVVTVTDTVPLDLKITAVAGAGWNCAINDPTVFGNKLTCTRTTNDGLAPSAFYSADITVTVDVATNARNEFVNVANVSTPPDINTANNFGRDITIVNQIDLSIIKTAPASLAQRQTGALYTLTVYNLGASPTNGTPVIVTDTVPSDLKITGINTTPSTSNVNGWTCSINNANFGNTITCTRSDSLAGDTSPGAVGPNNSPYSGGESNYPVITLTVEVSATATTVINIGKVSGGGDVNTSNNEFIVSTVVSIPKLNLIKRITQIASTDTNGNPINPVNITTFSAGTIILNNSDANDSKWPTPLVTYLRGGIDCITDQGATTCDGVKGAKPGDLVEYTIYFLANGNENLKNTQICDAIPLNTTFNQNTYGPGQGILLGWNSTNLPNPDATVGSGEVVLTNALSFITTPDSTAPEPCKTSVTTRGAVLVKFAARPSPVIPFATGSGTPVDSYGFVRFKVKVN